MMTVQVAPDRLDEILNAAFYAFAQYGYRRTSMDDIARGAGLSRTALYQHFRNKEDLFRRLTLRFFDSACLDLQQALAEPGQSAADAILAGLIAKDGKFMQVVLGTPHGSELMDAGTAISADIVAAGEARMQALFADWMAQNGVAQDLGTPATIAAALMLALKGLKTGAASLADYRAGQHQLARVFGRALEQAAPGEQTAGQTSVSR